MSEDRLAVARQMVHDHVGNGGSPSVAATVARRGKIVLAEAAGVQGPHGAPLTLDHIWPVASVAKPLTAAVVLSLVEDGVLGINEPMATHIPELAGHPDVLIHHLLTHTAGWESAQRTKRLEKAMADGSLLQVDLDRDLISLALLGLALDPIKVCEPGERMDYDNGHYTLLSEIVRRITGTTLDAAMRERLFDPLEMNRCAIIVPDSLRGDAVTRAEGLPFGPGSPLAFEGEVWEACDSGAAGAFLAPGDLIRFGQMILEGGALGGTRVLSPASVRSMTTNRVPGVPAAFGDREIPEAQWGYGFTIVSAQPFAYFVGGLVPDGSVAHPGAGGIAFWIDFEHEIVGLWFEVIKEISEFTEPISGICHRFQNVVTAAATE